MSSTIRIRWPTLVAGSFSAGLRDRRRSVLERRQAYLELAPVTEPLAARFDRSAVHLHHRLDQRQADAQPVARAFQGRVHLGEHLEEVRKLLGRDADAVVPHAHDHLRAFVGDRQPDVAAPVGELARVVEQVADHLRQPRGVGAQIERLRRQRHRQLVVQAAVPRARRLDGLLDDRPELDGLLAKLELAARDAAEVEQVVDQARQLAHLTFDHPQRRACHLCVAVSDAQGAHGVADRGQRVAQLVRQHREELVLAAVGFGQVVGQLPPLGDVLADRGEGHRSAGVVRQGQHLVGHPARLAGLEVPEADLDLAVALSRAPTGRTRP